MTEQTDIQPTSDTLLAQFSALHESVTFQDLPPKTQAAILQEIQKDDWKTQGRAERTKYQFPPAVRDAFLEEWVSQKSSPDTARAYRHRVKFLFFYLDSRNIHIFDVTPSVTDHYLSFLKIYYQRGKPATIRHHIAVCSAFYRKLIRVELYIKANPFYGIEDLPKKQVLPKYRVPTEKEIRRIETYLRKWQTKTKIGRGEHLRVKQAQWLLPAFHMLAVYGCRVGFLPSMVVNGVEASGFSKGEPRKILIPFTPKTLRLLKTLPDSSHPFANRSSDTIRGAITDLCRHMYDEKKLVHSYRPHDFRHAFAIREYRKAHDIERVRILLWHRSIETTQEYLRGLGYLKE